MKTFLKKLLRLLPLYILDGILAYFAIPMIGALIMGDQRWIHSFICIAVFGTIRYFYSGYLKRLRQRAEPISTM